MKYPYKELLTPHVPENSLHILLPLLTDTNLNIKLSGKRKRILGQFKVQNKSDNKLQITVTKSLNKFYFLVILIHELAHYYTWKKYNNKKLLPHGKQWQQVHGQLMEKFLTKEIFPEEVEKYLNDYMASGFTNKQVRLKLTLALQNYNEDLLNKDENKTVIGHLKIDEHFTYAGGIFKVKKINRTRLLAESISKDKKMFSFYKALTVDKV